MDFKFEKLESWQTAMSFGEEVFLCYQRLPKGRLVIALTSQIRRAVDPDSFKYCRRFLTRWKFSTEFRKFVAYILRAHLQKIVHTAFTNANENF